MRINPIELTNKSKFILDYRKEREAALKYFDYSPFNNDEQRLNDIHKRQFKRDELVNILNEMNDKWDAPEQTMTQIERLKDENSVVVIGGQQAGLVTGPMYTINKIISIVQLARQKEKQLNIPVIPVFWIAGEDHDYDEINHVYINDNNKMKKVTTKQQVLIKKSISNIDLDKENTEHFLKQLFLSLHETEHTKKLYDQLQTILKKSDTFTDFFARTIFYLFQEEGIVLIDSNDYSLRKLESDFFVNIIEKQQQFAQAVVTQLESLRQEGHSISVDAELDDAHLFLQDEYGERILLKREGDMWVGKNEEVQLNTEQLLTIARNKPEQLSNNVISRPMMQEYLFPTLSFVAGDGEISYWATLKKAFHLFDLNVPPVIPRLSFTFVNKKAKSILDEQVIQIDSVINDGVSARKINWLTSQQSPAMSTMIEQVKNEIEKVHTPLQQVAKSVSESAYQVAQRNLHIINREIDFLENKINNELKQKYDVELERFDYIGNLLQPNGVLQERVWNPIPFINEHSEQFISELVQHNCRFEHDHYVVYL